MVINKVIIGGNIVSMDEKVKTMDNEKETSKFKFVIATTESWKVKETKERKYKTQFTNVVVYGDKANELPEIFHVGMPIMIEGKLNNHSYDNPNFDKKIHDEKKDKLKWYSEVIMFKYKTADQMMSGSNATNVENELPIKQVNS